LAEKPEPCSAFSGNGPPKISQGGAEVVPAVVSGDVQVGYSNNVDEVVRGE
jgi:hypothetical protein